MSKSRVLITGGTGLLALNWACAVRSSWDVVLATHLHSVDLPGTTSRPVELDDPARCGAALDDVSPDLVVHTAGLANVDGCEQHPSRAHHDNAELARNVALACSACGISLIHISTDQLFAGDRSFYPEAEAPRPLNEYARSKLVAEQWVREACPGALIIRTNFFGWGHAARQSLSDWIIYNLRAGNPLTLFDDVKFTPILADSLALAAHELVERSASGIFNVVGDERMSKYEFGELLAQRFQLARSLIRRGQVGSAKLLAPRQRDMSLSNSKARETLGRSLGTIEEYLSVLWYQEEQKRPGELIRATSG